MSYQIDNSVNFGPRPRSEEHIIPKSVFGRIVTHDLCRTCNSFFGEVFDHALPNDGRMIDAARNAGFELEQLRPTFRGIQRSSSGRSVAVTFQNGGFRIDPEVSKEKFGFGITNGRIADRDFRDATAFLIAKIKRTRLGWSPQTIELLVNNLMKRIREEPTRIHLDMTLGEGWVPTNLNNNVEVSWQYHPWETDWCLAKIVYESTQLCWPPECALYCKSVADFFSEFMHRRDGDRELGGRNRRLSIFNAGRTAEGGARHFVLDQPAPPAVGSNIFWNRLLEF